jgi:hypothetical protein
MQHVMLDLETLGTSTVAAPISIGAVIFDPFKQGHVGGEFELFIDPADAQRVGMRVEWDTVKWWMDGRQDVPRALLLKNMRDALDLPTVLGLFRDFLGTERTIMWGNGAGFDNVILGNAYRAIGEEQPWKFYDDRCFRTIKNLAPDIEKPNLGLVAHSALNDAKVQARHLQNIVRAKGITSL